MGVYAIISSSGKGKMTRSFYKCKIYYLRARSYSYLLLLLFSLALQARKHLLEAAIVRIMKTRKTLDHNSLIAEVMKQVSPRFTPSLGDIKKRIEGLLERDYLERDEDQKQTYHYLA